MVEYYLSTPEVAEELDINLSTLNSRISAGDFQSPDAVLGGRAKGWSRSTIDALKKGTFTYQVDTDAILGIIVQIRSCAEWIRAYGRGSENQDPGISGVIPDELYAFLGRLESAVRGAMLAEIRVGNLYVGAPAQENDFQVDANASLDRYFDADRVYIGGAIDPETSNEERAQMLRQTGHRLDDESRALRKALKGHGANTFHDTLADLTARVHAYVDALAPDQRPRVPQIPLVGKG
ncbi:helix-turn-helix transcriptional regulator [Mycobacteroides salmoniphilum]|nr:hypothetical protein [Mycobacteroides salmoniphilum]